jgi:hypothetical protein
MCDPVQLRVYQIGFLLGIPLDGLSHHGHKDRDDQNPGSDLDKGFRTISV